MLYYSHIVEWEIINNRVVIVIDVCWDNLGFLHKIVSEKRYYNGSNNKSENYINFIHIINI